MAIMDLVTSQAIHSLNLAMTLMRGGDVPEEHDLHLAVMKVEHIMLYGIRFCAGLYIAGHDCHYNFFWDGALDHHLPAEEQH